MHCVFENRYDFRQKEEVGSYVRIRNNIKDKGEVMSRKVSRLQQESLGSSGNSGQKGWLGLRSQCDGFIEVVGDKDPVVILEHRSTRTISLIIASTIAIYRFSSHVKRMCDFLIIKK